MGAKSKGRIPRNKKKSWKKQVDISEVEEYLDDVRLQERFGGLVAEKASEDIFTIDNKPDVVDVSTASKPRRRCKVNQDNLRCFQNLKGLHGAKVPVKTGFIKDKRPAFVKEKTASKKAKRTAKAEGINDVEVKKRGDKKKQLPNDPWADDDKSDSEDWAEAGILNLQRSRTECRVRRPLYMRVKTSLLPAVETPHAGQSYHPEAGDHEALLEKAVTVEHRKQAEFQRWERQTTAKFPRSRPTEADWIEEMSGGLQGEDAVEDDTASSGPLTRKVPKPKTRVQRRKMAERKVAERSRLATVSKRRMENEVFRVRTLKREMSERAARTLVRQARRLEAQSAKATQPLTLGRHRYEAASIELSLGDELPGNLRNLRPEGDPLEERYKSLQRRNVIETRTRTTQKKTYKRKHFDRITLADRENKIKGEGMSWKKK